MFGPNTKRRRSFNVIPHSTLASTSIGELHEWLGNRGLERLFSELFSSSFITPTTYVTMENAVIWKCMMMRKFKQFGLREKMGWLNEKTTNIFIGLKEGMGNGNLESPRKPLSQRSTFYLMMID
jgi:hypothetical protein